MIGIGHRVRDYEVVGHLKPGGMATLFLARRVGPEGFVRPVVIKVVHPHLATDPELVRMFLDEARLSAAIQHPNVVHVEELGESDGNWFLAMEYLPGESLSTLLAALARAGRRLEPRIAAWIARCAAAGLHAAHEARDPAGAGLGIIHRDISPQNLLVSIDGHVKVIDFGIAKSERATTETQVGTLKGKLSYMSPEQARAERVDRRTDVYAVGIVLWEMLTLRRRFAGTEVEVLDAVRDPRPIAPGSLAAGVPAALDEVVLRALEPDRADRYPTCEALEQALVRAVPESAQPELARLVREQLGERIEARRRELHGPLPADRSPAPPPRGVTSGWTDATQKREPTSVGRQAERRQLTMLSCELPERATLLPDDQRACVEIVERFGGVRVAAPTLRFGFGYPVAYEDAAQRAIRAGLALRDEAPIALRMGVHTGPVVAGDPEETIVGEAVTVAVELGGAADPGAVLVSGATWRIVQGWFDGEARGRRAVKGKVHDVHRILRQRESQSRIELAKSGTTGLSPLVGRDREVGLLLDRWEQVKEEQPQVAMLVGEPGIGKSRLTYVLREHVQREHDSGEPRVVVEWRCSALHRDSSFHPATELVERHLRFRRDEPADAKLARLERWLTQAGMPLDEAVPVFAALVGLPLPARYPALQLTPERLRQQTLHTLAEWLRRSAQRAPVLFLVEDLHWVDASTLDLLRTLVVDPPAERLFLVLTFRPEWKPPWNDPRVTQVPLQRLNKRQVAELLQKRSARALPPEVAEQVAARSDGVPLFVEECTNMLLETGLLREVDGRYVLTGELPRDAIPATLHDLLTARLDRLGDAKEVAQLGATLGREFSHELLQAVATAPVDDALARLLDAELLQKKGRPPQQVWSFKHALIQDAAYASLLKAQRQETHLRIAEVLEARFPEIGAGTPEVLAHHFTAARLPERAIPYWARAGAQARDRSANPEAIGHFTRALELLGPLPESPDKDARELGLQIPLGTAYLSAKGYAAPEGGPVFARARVLAERIGVKPQLFAVMWGTWAWHVVRGDFRLCVELGAEAMALARELGDPGITMEALFLPGLTQLYRGDFAGSRAHCERAVTTLDDRALCAVWAGHTGQNSGVTHRSYLAVALWHLGFPERALAVAGEAVARAREVQHPYSLVYALHHAAWLYDHCRLGDAAEAAATEQLQIAREHCFALFEITAGLYRAAGRLHQGRAAEALPELQRGIVAYEASGAGLALPYYLSRLAEAQRGCGQAAEALATLARALEVAEANDDRFHVAELHRQRGELVGPDEADACFRRSLEVARRQGARSWKLRTLTSLARRGDVAALAEVLAGFPEGDGTPDLVDARAALRR